MSRRTRRAAGALSLGLLAAGSWAAGAGRATTARTVTPTSESWYAAGPTAPLVPARQYPADTLHVGETADQEDARTYLALPVAPAEGNRVVGGVLVLPTAADAGTLRPEAARIVACAVEEDVPDGAAGDPDGAPEADCDTWSPASHEPDEQRFVVDLSPLLPKAGADGVLRLSLVPDPALADASDTWHVGFSGRQREGEGVQPIVAVLDDEAVEAEGGGEGADEEPGGGGEATAGSDAGGSDPLGDLGDVPFTFDGSSGSFEALPAPPDGVVPDVLPVAPFDVVTTSFAGPLRFHYPVVYLFPLLLVGGLAALHWVVTVDLSRPPAP